MTNLYQSMLEATAESLRDVVKTNPALGYPLSVVANLASKIAADIDGYVPVRLREIECIKALLSQGHEFAPAGLAVAIEEGLNLSPVEPEDYRISSLDTTCGRLRALLIDLHECLETMGDPAVRGVLRDILSFLEADVQLKSSPANMLW